MQASLEIPGNTRVVLALHVCESTVNSPFWPVNGVQCTPFDTWRKLYNKATYHVTHAPLSKAARAKFNATAALQYFDTVNGVDYGYFNFLFGWIDVESKNYPCVPGNFKTCLHSQHIDLFFSLLDNIDHSFADKLAKQALNHRLNSAFTSIADIFMAAGKQGLTTAQLYSIVEQDSWTYKTTRSGKPFVGPSMTCCVFVCHMWKAAGMFDDIGRDTVNCAETTNWDVYSLHFFEDNYDARPQVCQDADPEGACCQLEGPYTLQFNDYSTREPYSHMAENCPGQNPFYQKPPRC